MAPSAPAPLEKARGAVLNRGTVQEKTGRFMMAQEDGGV